MVCKKTTTTTTTFDKWQEVIELELKKKAKWWDSIDCLVRNNYLPQKTVYLFYSCDNMEMFWRVFYHLKNNNIDSIVMLYQKLLYYYKKIKRHQTSTSRHVYLLYRWRRQTACKKTGGKSKLQKPGLPLCSGVYYLFDKVAKIFKNEFKLASLQHTLNTLIFYKYTNKYNFKKYYNTIQCGLEDGLNRASVKLLISRLRQFISTYNRCFGLVRDGNLKTKRCVVCWNKKNRILVSLSCCGSKNFVCTSCRNKIDTCPMCRSTLYSNENNGTESFFNVNYCRRLDKKILLPLSAINYSEDKFTVLIFVYSNQLFFFNKKLINTVMHYWCEKILNLVKNTFQNGNIAVKHVMSEESFLQTCCNLELLLTAGITLCSQSDHMNQTFFMDQSNATRLQLFLSNLQKQQSILVCDVNFISI